MAEPAQKTILVIDDEPDIVTFLTVLFEDEGYAALSAYNGQDGLEVAQREVPDLITLDITMPEKTGVRLYRELRLDELLKGTPVIIITGVMKEFEGFIHSRRQVPPPDGYFSKPVDKDQLLAKVRELIGS